MMLTTLASPGLGAFFSGRFGKQHQTRTLESGLFVEKHHQIVRLIEIEADRFAADLRMNAIGQRPDGAGDHIPVIHQRSNRHMDLPGHGETGVVHPLKLVVGRKTVHKHRLAVHSYLVRQARRRVRIGRVRRDHGKCRRNRHHEQYGQTDQPSASHFSLLLEFPRTRQIAGHLGSSLTGSQQKTLLRQRARVKHAARDDAFLQPSRPATQKTVSALLLPFQL